MWCVVKAATEGTRDPLLLPRLGGPEISKVRYTPGLSSAPIQQTTTDQYRNISLLSITSCDN